MKRIDASCPRVRDLRFEDGASPDFVAGRVQGVCGCTAAINIVADIEFHGQAWLDVNLRPSGEKESEK